MQFKRLRMILTLRCEGAARLLSDAQERPLSLAERLALAGHLLACVWCRRYRDQLGHLARFMAQLRASAAGPAASAATKLSATAKDRIRTRIVRAMEQRND